MGGNRLEVGQVAGVRQLVQDSHLPASMVRQECADECGADEARSAGHQQALRQTHCGAPGVDGLRRHGFARMRRPRQGAGALRPELACLEQ